MRLLMPKPFRKNKLTIFKRFTLIDFLVFLLLIAVDFLLVAFLPISGMWKIILMIPLLIPIIILILYNTKHDCRNYVLIFRWFKSWSYVKKFTKKPIENKQDEKSKSKKIGNGYTDNLVAIEKIEYEPNSGIAIAKTKSLSSGVVGYFSAFKINGLDISNYSDEEREIDYDSLAGIFKQTTFRISLVKISKIYNLQENQSYLENKINDIQGEDEESMLMKEIYSSYLESLDNIKNNSFENCYYVVVYAATKKDLVMQMQDLSARFDSDKLETKFLKRNEIVQLQLDIIDNQNNINIKDEDFEPIIDDETGEIIEEALSVDDYLAFDKIEFHKSKILINEKLNLNIQSIAKFPLSINYHWLDSIFSSPSSVVVHIDPVSYEEARSQIHKSNLNLKTNALDSGVNNTVDNIDLAKTQEALEELAERIALGEEELKRFQIFFVNSSMSDEGIRDLQKINDNLAQRINCVINPLVFQQFESFENIILKSTDNIKYYQETTDSTLAGGWPFSTSDFNDGNGFIVGQTDEGNVICFDQFKTDSSRTNYNMMILGASGAGKSSFTKKLAMYHISEGNQNIIIDPESEYKVLLRQFGGYFNGSYYALGGDARTKFNPLQIQNQYSDSDNEDDLDEIRQSNHIIMYQHVEWFGNWMRILFPDLNDDAIRFVEQNLRALYESWFKKEIKIENIANLEPKDYPIMSDLIKQIKSKNSDDIRRDKIVEILEHHFEKGKLGLIYNGHSNVSLDDQLIIFDVQAIFNDDSLASGRAALYIIISRINNQLIINYRKNLEDKKKIVLYIDEAHLLLDKDNPTTINFLHRTVKRIRKYHGGVVLTTQNPGDFADGGDSKKLANILNNIQYSFILKMKSQDVEAVSDLYRSQGGLTEYEKKNLVRITRGQCLFNPSHAVRKFIKFYYNEMEKQVSWANYVPETEIEETIELEQTKSNNEEMEILLPKPLKAIYMFFYNLKHKNNNKSSIKEKNDDNQGDDNESEN